MQKKGLILRWAKDRGGSVSGKSERNRLDAIEETQASLRNDIEASKALIRRSEALLDDCRRRSGVAGGGLPRKALG